MINTRNAIQIFDELEQANHQKKIFAQLNQTYTYSDLTTSVRKLSSYFDQKGLKLSDRVIISTTNKYAASVLIWACLRNGVTAVFLDPSIGTKRSEELITQCDIVHFFIDNSSAERWQLDKSKANITLIGEQVKKKGSILKKLLKKPKVENTTSDSKNFWSIIENSPPSENLITTIDPESIAYILFTSGSTSTPKAVQISHRALWANLTTISNVYELNENSNIFNILTIYHTDGIMQGPVLTAMNKASWYHPMEFEVGAIGKIFDALYKYEISHFITVPTMLKFLFQFGDGYEDSFQEPSFKHIVTSAAPLEEKFWIDFEAKFNVEIVNNYGLTETVAGASYCGPEPSTRKVGSIGKPIDCEYKIIDADGLELGTNETGELLIKGSNLLSNYLNNEEATNEALSDGWFHTGDLAKKDEEGFYFITGRKKNIIISGGINIQPEEVMAILNSHPSVLESACVGMEDDLFGEIAIAGVVLKEGSSINTLELTEFCRQELEEAKIPKQFFFVNQLPKTSSGKIKFSELKPLFKLQNQGENNQSSEQLAIQQTILTTASTTFKCPVESIEFNTANTLTLAGWDSLAHLAFITELEENYKVRFSSKEIMSMSSLKEVHTALKNKL